MRKSDRNKKQPKKRKEIKKKEKNWLCSQGHQIDFSRFEIYSDELIKQKQHQTAAFARFDNLEGKCVLNTCPTDKVKMITHSALKLTGIIQFNRLSPSKANWKRSNYNLQK